MTPVFAGDYSHTPNAAGCFENAIDAAVAAGTLYLEHSRTRDVEFMGAVLETAQGYSYTVAAGEPSRDEITVTIRKPRSSRIVAFWHTHGSRHYSRKYFSDTDTSLVNSTSVPLFLMDPRGNLRVFRPGDKLLTALQSRRLGLGTHSGFARGSLVASVRPTGPEPAAPWLVIRASIRPGSCHPARRARSWVESGSFRARWPRRSCRHERVPRGLPQCALGE